MPGRLSWTKVFHVLEHALGVTQKRHALIASNLSNLDTPDYRPKEIDFKKALTHALEPSHEFTLVRTNPRHIELRSNSPKGAEPFEDKGEWNGFNWVDIDREMIKLSENNLTYRSTTEILLRKISLLKEVIKEGGR